MKVDDAARARIAEASQGPASSAPVLASGVQPDPSKAGVGRPQKVDPVRVLTTAALTAYALVAEHGKPYAVLRGGVTDDMPPDLAALYGMPGVAQPIGEALGHRIVALARRSTLPTITRGTRDTVLLQLQSLAAVEGPAVELHLRFAHDPGARRVVLDLGRPKGGFVVIHPHGWTIQDAPPAGVVFRRSHATRPLPMPVRGGRLDALAPVLAMDPVSREFRALVGWLVGLPFAASVRPGVLAWGPPGSGKSTRLRLLASVLEPSGTEALGSAFGRNFADDQVRASHRAIPLWDNLTAVSGSTSDALCTIVTGSARETRALYSDNELHVAPVKRPVGLTAVGIPAGLRPDALDRLITVELGPMPARLADAEVQARFDAAHPALLGAVCDALAAVLAYADRVPAPVEFRMAAHAHVLAALDAAAAEALPGCPADLLGAYADLHRQAKQRTAAEDTFGAAVLALLEDRGGQWQGRATELLLEAGYFSPHSERAVGWPSSARRVPEVLAHLREGLEALGVSWETTTVRGKTRYALRLTDGEDCGAEAAPPGHPTGNGVPVVPLTRGLLPVSGLGATQ